MDEERTFVSPQTYRQSTRLEDRRQIEEQRIREQEEQR